MTMGLDIDGRVTPRPYSVFLKRLDIDNHDLDFITYCKLPNFAQIFRTVNKMIKGHVVKQPLEMVPHQVNDGINDNIKDHLPQQPGPLAFCQQHGQVQK